MILKTTSLVLMSVLAFNSATAPATWACAVEPWVPADLVAQILRDPQIRPYLHLEIPERQPVLVCGTFVGPDFDPTTVDFKLRIVPHVGANERLFQFTSVQYDAKRAEVELAYPLEGLRGRFIFAKREGVWTLKTRKLWEE